MNCKHCNHEVSANYCPHCGHPAVLKRIDGHYIRHEIEHVLHFESGILHTIKELVINPGQNIRIYLAENRSRLVKPIVFILVTSLFYSLCNHFFHFEDAYVKYQDTEKSTTSAIFKWVQSHYGYSNILIGIFIAFWVKLFFRKRGYNFYEILILLCFVIGIGMLIFSVFGIMQAITGVKLMTAAGIAGFMYLAWAIGDFYGKGQWLHYVKALFAYILGMLSFSLAAILIGTLVDQFI